MNRARVLVALLACVTTGASGTLHAQARGPVSRGARVNAQQIEKPPLVLDEAARVSRIAEMEAWLGRLVGRFGGEATLISVDQIQRVPSVALCRGIGDGPGVRCDFRTTPPPPRPPLPGMIPPITFTQAERASYIFFPVPILYFGINPDTLEIQLVAVDPHQPSGRSGMLAGDTVDFSVDNWKVCYRVWTTCWVAAEITATPVGEIFMKLAADRFSQGHKMPNLVRPGHSTYVELHLHREPPADAEMPRNAP